MLMLGAGVLLFIVGNRNRLKRLPQSEVLVAGFCILLIGWTLTIIEGFLWRGFLNFMEHVCYSVSSVLVAVWCWKVFGGSEEADR
jgi:hypothetical protein